MNKQEFETSIQKFIELEDNFTCDNQKLGELFGVDSIAENVFMKHWYELRDHTLSCMSQYLGIDMVWLDWYFYEVKLNHNLSATIDGVEYKCKDVSGLWELIVALREGK